MAFLYCAAVLPDGLHRAVRPPVALPPELAERGRHLRPGPRPSFVGDLPPGPVDGHGEIGVLGEGVVADPTDLGHSLAPEGADGTRHDRHAPERLVHPAVEVESHGVFDVLPAAEDASAVPDLGVPGHGAHGGVGQRAHQVADAVRLEDGVPVDHDDDVVAGGGDAGVQGGRLPAVGLDDEPHAGIVDGLDHGGRPVGGAVVDDDDLQRRIVIAGQGADSGGDADLFVVGGDDDADRGVERRLCRALRRGEPGLTPDLASGQGHQGDAPDQGQGHEREHEEAEDPVDGRRHPEGQQQGETLEAVEPVDRAYGRPRRQPRQPRHRREAVALALQLGNESVDGLHGLAPVTAGVMQEHDTTLPGRRRAAGDDGVRPGLAPVLAVFGGEDQQVAEVRGPPGGGQLGVGHRRRVRRVRQPQEMRLDPGRAGQRALGEAHLDAGPQARCRPEVGVGEGVGPDLVPGGELRPHELRVPGSLGAHDEEGGRDAVASEDFEDLRRPLRVWPVVEGQSHGLVRQRR